MAIQPVFKDGAICGYTVLSADQVEFVCRENGEDVHACARRAAAAHRRMFADGIAEFIADIEARKPRLVSDNPAPVRSARRGNLSLVS